MDSHSILDHDDTPERRLIDTRPVASETEQTSSSSKSNLPEAAAREWPGTVASAPLAPAELSFPGEDGGKSLAGMAQKDLTATLQLLAEQAQYITGATGAAIALREHGEMVCLASSGSSAPEVGSLLQVNSGLSGESVRTRQTLRCDDAATDTRVNRESCEALGIASVVVMPLVQDDDVIGVFELFSNKARVFEGRDITALERMGAMVFTALEHAVAAHGVTMWAPPGDGAVSGTEMPVVGEVPDVSSGDDVSSGNEDQMTVSDPSVLGDATTGGDVAPTRNEESGAEVGASSERDSPDTVSGIVFHGQTTATTSPGLTPDEPHASAVPLREENDDILGELAPEKESASGGEVVSGGPSPSSVSPVVEQSGEDSILEDAPTSPRVASGERATAEHAGAGKAADPALPIRSAVANLKKCEACGFPISEGRQLCLDCEKKRAQSGDSATPLTGAAGHVSETAIGSPPAVTASEAGLEDGPRFFSNEEEETSWLANHKYMVMAIAIAVAIIVALLLAH
jgi:L-methionine (R)-S-oxide reductase